MDIKLELFDKNQLCPACLCLGRTLQSVTDRKLASYYLNVLNEIPLCDVPTKCPSICWECAAVLRGIVAFREQVKDSFRILQTYTKENLTECLLTDVIRPARLRLHPQESISIEADTVTELEAPTDRLGEGKTAVFVKDEGSGGWSYEVKQERPLSDAENRSCTSDCSEDIDRLEAEVNTVLGQERLLAGDKPLSEEDSGKKIRSVKADKGKKVQKTEKSAKKVKKKPAAKQKIITVDLSVAEIEAERARDAAREVFTRAQWRCDTCLVHFSCRGTFAQHMDTKHNSELGNYTCPVCKTVVASVESFTAHYKRHRRRYECGACGKRTADRKAMRQHYECTHEPKRRQYTCKDCGTVSKSADAHRYHREKHRARAQCSECDKSFSHRAGLMNHRLTVHKLNNAFPCSACDKVFRWKTSLKKHMEKHTRKDPAGARPAHCEPCDVHFASVCSYQRHLRHSLRHVTPEQHKFICDHCGRHFANKTKLRDHIEEKHLLKTYQCHICQKPSKNRSCLDQHLRNVHKGRPNNKMCHHCGKGFPTKMQLESHIRSHTGERPFICEFCPTTFSQQSNLYKHYRQIHLNIKTKRYAIASKKGKSGTQTDAPAMPAPLANHTTVAVLTYNQDKQFVVQYDGVNNVTIV